MADKTSVQRGGKSMQVKARSLTRSMTTGTQVATLPKGARILGFMLNGVASDAATTATVSIGNTSTATEYVSGADVKTAAAGRGPTLLAGVSGAMAAVLTAPTPIFFKYAETGTASTVGGWTVAILYTTGNIVNDDTV